MRGLNVPIPKKWSFGQFFGIALILYTSSHYLGASGDVIGYLLGGGFLAGLAASRGDVVHEGLGGLRSRAGSIWMLSYLLHEELKLFVFGDFQLWLRYILVIPVRRAVWFATHLK